ncbi:MAG: hypothetical protein U9Q30_09120, partial [Campylobacterota bacterium]|nr:hypothetical protein [Campylobacterota bacterium]
MREIELFKSLFQKDPNISILNIDNGCEDIKKILEDIVDEVGGNLAYKKLEDINENRFRLVAREYEYVVLTDILTSIDDIDKFIQTCYHSLENSAQIILIAKKDNQDIYSLLDILDRNDFRASNDIDIFDKYNLVMAKKMHMW